MTTLPTAPAPGRSEKDSFSTFALMRGLFSYKPGLFLANVLAWGIVQASPTLLTYCFALLFDRLKINDIHVAWLLVLGFAVVRFVRFGVFAAAFTSWIRLWYTLDALVRHNLLAHLLTARGTRRLPDTPAEAVSRFRDDVDDVAQYTETWVDGGGILISILVTVALLWHANPLITVIVCTPLLVMVLVMQRLSPVIRSFRRRMREATSRVTDFVGETFAAVGSVKLSGNEAHMTAHMQELGQIRRNAALKDVLLTELIRNLNTNLVQIGIAVVLLMGASQLRGGTMTVGALVLFGLLLPRMASSMTFFGNMIAQHRRTGVAFERMTRLIQDAPPQAIVAHHELYLDSEPPSVAAPQLKVDPLERLQVKNLSAVHDSGRGVHDVSFELRRGEFVVITGRIGSGKTTLLRAVLGLLPHQRGQIFWNGQMVTDPASFFVPPRSAYTAQLPNLFSESLRENVLLGEQEERLDVALELAVMRPDLGQFGSGLDTQVGARGVKLSGGQLQRSAVARMLARPAELLVFDDVSSALDTRTEQQLWSGLAAAREVTCLVVSHRRAALARADRIVVLENGVVTDSGSLDELLIRSAEMRALWDGEERPLSLPA